MSRVRSDLTTLKLSVFSDDSKDLRYGGGTTNLPQGALDVCFPSEFFHILNHSESLPGGQLALCESRVKR